MRLQNEAGKVLERTSHFLKSGMLKEKPVWYDVVINNPPHLDLTKKANKIKFAQYEDIAETLKNDNKTRLSPAELKNKNNQVHRPAKLQFFEDELRNLFYRHHPWEFSRPKNLVENEGNDNAKCDWSHMLQLSKPLDGESVVQRTLWLLKQEKLELFDAYDKARFEFYRLRMEEEMSSLVSREESNMFGAQYPSDNLQWGIKQEQQHIDVWAKVAHDRTKVKMAAQSNRDSQASGGGEEPDKKSSSMFESIE